MTNPKFRVWDGDEMLYPGQEEHDKALVLSQHGDLYYIRPSEMQLDQDHTVGRARWEHNGLEVMFYTGLTDAEGTEIYEGDVVRMPEEWDHSLWIVSWEPDHATYWINAVNGMPDWSYATDAMEGEVVGNRYKNPSLLEAPTDQ